MGKSRRLHNLVYSLAALWSIGFALLGLTGQVVSANEITLSEEFIHQTHQDQIAALRAILLEVKTHYGMAKFKEAQFGITLPKLEEKYTRLIINAQLPEEVLGLSSKVERSVLSHAEFQQLMIAFAAEFKDGHFNILRETREAWSLGLRAAAIDGRLYIVGFNGNLFDPATVYPRLEVGDEILSIDGESVQAIAKRNEVYVPLATPASRRQWALEMVVNVSHRFMLKKETGDDVVLKFRRGAQEITGRFHWINTKDLQDLSSLSRYLMPDPLEQEKRAAVLTKDIPYVYGQSSTFKTYWSEGLKNLKLPVMDVGLMLNAQIVTEREKKKAKSPNLDPELLMLEPVDRLAAYTVHIQGKTLGVIRIPDYSPQGGFEAVIHELNWLARVVGMFENTTDGLIIDQLSNGGGYVYLFSQFLRLFAHEQEIGTQLIDIRLSETFFNAYDRIEHPLGNPNPGFEGSRRPFSRVYMEKALMSRLRAQFDAGQKWSGFVGYGATGVNLFPGVTGTAVAMPGKVYSKPMMVLNDGRSASGGDFMPASMQTSGRALIFGEKSMGLGGPVYRSQSAMPGSELFMRCTMGFCLREDGLPIENVGVVPDVVRPLRARDLADGYTRYARDVLVAALAHVDGHSAGAIMGAIRAKREKETPSPAKPFYVTLLENRLKETQDAAQIKEAYLLFFKTFIAQLKAPGGAQVRLKLPLPTALLDQDLLLAAENTSAGVIERLIQLKSLQALDAGWSDVADTIIRGIAAAKGRLSVEREVCASMLEGFKKEVK